MPKRNELPPPNTNPMATTLASRYQKNDDPEVPGSDETGPESAAISTEPAEQPDPVYTGTPDPSTGNEDGPAEPTGEASPAPAAKRTARRTPARRTEPEPAAAGGTPRLSVPRLDAGKLTAEDRAFWRHSLRSAAGKYVAGLRAAAAGEDAWVAVCERARESGVPEHMVTAAAADAGLPT